MVLVVYFYEFIVYMLLERNAFDTIEFFLSAGPCNWLKSMNNIFSIKVSPSATNGPKYSNKKKTIRNLGISQKNNIFKNKLIDKNDIYYNNFNLYLGLFEAEVLTSVKKI